MSKDKRTKIEIDRAKEMRTKETSRMISEGGLGSRTFYDIKKVSSPEKELQDVSDQNEDTEKSEGKEKSE